jgi:thioredoxin-related protein
MFEIPKKWYIIIDEENIEYCKKLKNRELNQKEGYDYLIGGFYSKLVDCPGYCDTHDVKLGWIEISFEVFKKYIVEGYKEPKPKKQSYKYLIKIFKRLEIK